MKVEYTTERLMADPVLEAASRLIWYGCCILPLPSGAKAPPPAGWTDGARHANLTLPALQRHLRAGGNWAAGILGFRVACLDFDDDLAWRQYLRTQFVGTAAMHVDTPHGGHAWLVGRSRVEPDADAPRRERSVPVFGAHNRASILHATGAESLRTRGMYALGPGSTVNGKTDRLRPHP